MEEGRGKRWRGHTSRSFLLIIFVQTYNRLKGKRENENEKEQEKQKENEKGKEKE